MSDATLTSEPDPQQSIVPLAFAQPGSAAPAPANPPPPPPQLALPGQPMASMPPQAASVPVPPPPPPVAPNASHVTDDKDKIVLPNRASAAEAAGAAAADQGPQFQPTNPADILAAWRAQYQHRGGGGAGIMKAAQAAAAEMDRRRDVGETLMGQAADVAQKTAGAQSENDTANATDVEAERQHADRARDERFEQLYGRQEMAPDENGIMQPTGRRVGGLIPSYQKAVDDAAAQKLDAAPKFGYVLLAALLGKNAVAGSLIQQIANKEVNAQRAEYEKAKDKAHGYENLFGMLRQAGADDQQATQGVTSAIAAQYAAKAKAIEASNLPDAQKIKAAQDAEALYNASNDAKAAMLAAAQKQARAADSAGAPPPVSLDQFIKLSNLPLEQQQMYANAVKTRNEAAGTDKTEQGAEKISDKLRASNVDVMDKAIDEAQNAMTSTGGAGLGYIFKKPEWGSEDARTVQTALSDLVINVGKLSGGKLSDKEYAVLQDKIANVRTPADARRLISRVRDTVGAIKANVLAPYSNAEIRRYDQGRKRFEAVKYEK